MVLPVFLFFYHFFQRKGSILRFLLYFCIEKVTMFANANAMTTVGRRSLEALRLQPLGKPPQCFS